jgi:hypothetical protein
MISALAASPLCLSSSVEPDIVLDHCVRPDWHLAWIGQIELAEDDLVVPDLTKEILEDLNCQLLTRTPSVSEAEWSKASIVTNRNALSIDNTENRPKATIRDVYLASIFDLEIRNLKWASREADLLAFVFSNLSAGGNSKIPLRIERSWVFPVHRIQAGAGVRRANVAMALVVSQTFAAETRHRRLS